jgi:hypothetical protein
MAIDEKGRRYWAFSGPAKARETVHIGHGGGGLETRIQRSPFQVSSSYRSVADRITE